MTNPFVSDVPATRATIVENTLQLEIIVRNGADGTVFSGEQSNDLISWAPATYAGRTNNGDGQTSTLFFKGTAPTTGALEFLRMSLSSQN